MEIQPATLEQCHAAGDLWRRTGLTKPWNDPRTDFEFALGKQTSDVLAGTIDGQLVATALVGHDGHRGWVYYLAVDPDRQGQGLGARMMAAVEDWHRERGIWKINLMVRASNLAVKGFYESLGYAASDVTVLQKTL